VPPALQGIDAALKLAPFSNATVVVIGNGASDLLGGAASAPPDSIPLACLSSPVASAGPPPNS